MNRECSKPKVTCTRCGKDGHLDKHCKDVADSLKRSKTKKQKCRDVSFIIREDFDEFSFCGCIVSEYNDQNDCEVVNEYEIDELITLESQAIADSDSRVLTPKVSANNPLQIDDQHSFAVENSGVTTEDEYIGRKLDQGIELIMDSASQENVINNTLLFQELTPVAKKINLVGIGSHIISATHQGRLKEFDIEALYACKATNNILTIPRMVDCGYTFMIGHKAIEISLNGILHSVAYRNEKGFWTVPIHGLDVKTLLTLLDRHFTPEQVKRAHKARQLHICLGHLSDENLCIMLDTSNFMNCAVTSSDVRNAAVILGSCDACTAGKLVAPSFKSSQQEPASSIGEHLYVDLLELKERSIGCYYWFLVSVDEFSSYLINVGLKSKHTGQIEKALKTVISLYNSKGHRVDRITTDCRIGTSSSWRATYQHDSI